MKRPLIGEFLVLFAALPVVFLLSPVALPKLPCLLATAAGCGLLLWKDPAFDRAALRAFTPLRRFAPVLAGRAAAVAACLLAGVLLFEPESLLQFTKRNPRLWLLVMGLYPFLSALPQEFIFRVFFFHRYRSLFPTPTAMILASALAFAFMHIIFRNPVAPLLSLPAGWLFARTYAATGSLPAAAAEHALYGNILFTVGLGFYFYRGV